MSRLLWILMLAPIVLVMLAPCDDLRQPAVWLGASDDPTIDQLMTAVEAKDEATFRRLLRDPAIDLNCRDRDGHTPLTRAARIGWVDAVAALVEQGADPNVIDDLGQTPVTYAILIPAPQSNSILVLLTRHGADVNAPGPRGQTALMSAA